MDKEEGYPIKDEIKNHPAWRRLEDQLNWYDKKSLRNKKWYKGMRVIEIILACSIPIISFIDKGNISKWGSASFGAVIAILLSISGLASGFYLQSQSLAAEGAFAELYSFGA
ncbi:MAG: DUF4231 domain-containing protein, partial [bacterium]